MPYVGIFGRQFLITTLGFVKFKVSSKNKRKTLELNPKMPFWINLGENLKKLLLYLKSVSSNISNIKSNVKQKNLDFGTKNALFGYF